MDALIKIVKLVRLDLVNKFYTRRNVCYSDYGFFTFPWGFTIV